MGKNKSPNDQRSNSINPNNSDFRDSNDNRSNQLNPNNPEYKGQSEED